MNRFVRLAAADSSRSFDISIKTASIMHATMGRFARQRQRPIGDRSLPPSNGIRLDARNDEPICQACAAGALEVVRYLHQNGIGDHP
jgi:hypothetical protein